MAARKKAATDQLAEPAGDMVEMTKDGETIAVCPAQVEHHQRLGWVKK